MKNLIPHFIAENFKRGIHSGRLTAGTMFVDIWGFTALTDVLLKHGKEGVEILSRAINLVFTPSLEIVYQNKGFVSHFAGDSFLAIYPDNYSGALLSAIRILELFKEHHRTRTKFGEFDILAKIGLSYGRVEWGITGNRSNKTYYFKGEAVDGCADSESHCRLMEIVLDEVLFNTAGRMVIAKRLDNGFYRLEGMRKQSEQPGKRTTLDDIEDEIIGRFMPEGFIEKRPLDELRVLVSIFISFKKQDKDYESLNMFSDSLLDMVKKWGGYFNRISFGDKGGTVLINFGIPLSFENNIERALNCIIEIRSRYKDDIRAGITYGTLFSGFVGSRQRSAYDVLGDAVNMSSRIAMKAEWGSVWLSESIIEYAEKKFKTAYIDEFIFKGKGKPLKVYELKGKRDKVHEIYEGSLFGREKEILMLSEYIAPIFHKRFGGIVYIWGDAGIGKSRLLFEVENLLWDSADIFLLQCDNILKKSWNPFTGFLRNIFGQNQDIPAKEKETVFERRFEELMVSMGRIKDAFTTVNEINRTKSFLKAMLSLDTENTLYDESDPKQRYENTIYAVKELIKGLSMVKPLILCIEDIHWIDNESKELLRHLTRNISFIPLIVLCTGRFSDKGLKPVLELDNEIKESEIILHSLSDESTGSFLKEFLSAEIDDLLFEFIKEKTGNNPFFLEQFCLYLKEKNLIAFDKGKYHLIKKSSDIPSGISQIIIARFDRLSRELKEFIKIASVMGREFDIETFSESMDNLHSVKYADNHFMSANFDITALNNIWRTGNSFFLHEAEQGKIWYSPDDMRYIFNHSMVHSSVYDIQLRERLRFLHSIIAVSIEKRLSREEGINQDLYVDLGYHFEMAEIMEKARIYLQKAGDYLKENYKNLDAIDIYKRLIKCCDSEDEANIIITKKKIGEIFEVIGEWNKAEEIFKDCIRNSEKKGDKWLLADSYRLYGLIKKSQGDYKNAILNFEKAMEIFDEIGNRISYASAYGNLGNVYYYQGNYEKALECYELYKTIAEKSGDRQGIAKATGSIGNVYHHQGSYDKALECYEAHKKIIEETGDKRGIATVLGNIGIIYSIMDQYERAIEFHEKKRRISEEIGDKAGIGMALANMGITYSYMGEYDKALEFYQACRNIAEETGDKREYAITAHNMGNIYHKKGLYDIAVSYLEISRNILSDIGDRFGVLIVASKLGNVYYDEGKLENAKGCYEMTKNLSEELGNNFYLRVAMENLAYIYFDQGMTDKALSSFECSIGISEKLEIKDNFLLDCLLMKARIMLIKNDIPKARELLARVLKLAEETKNAEHKINALIEMHKTDALEDKDKALKSMLSMLKDKMSEEQKADILYNAYLLNKKKKYRDHAFILYKSLYESMPKYCYKKKMDELKH